MSLPTQSIGGLVSGFDTASIIESLMTIERRPVTKMENKILELEAQQEAYKSLNSMMLTFKGKVDIIGKYSSYDIKSSFSSNESILSATAYGGAQPGSYSFAVQRLAQTNQHVSSGFSNTNTSPVGAGTISIDSGKASFRNSTKLAELNGNMGVSRGSIRITDRAGNFATLDLAGAETIEDVLDTINSSYSIDVHAEISADGKGLTIKDTSGSTASNLIIQNFGSGSMAEDLGIETAGTAGDVIGSDIYTLSQTSSLSFLRDGLGIEKGIIHIADNVSAENYDIDLSKADSIKDVIDAINAIKDAGDNTVFNAQITGQGLEITNVLGNDFTITDDVSSEMATQLGIAGTSAGNLLTGSDIIGELDTVMLENISGKTSGVFTPGSIDITDRTGVLTNIDLTNAKTLRDVIDGINNSGAGVTAEINDIGNGITLKDTTGATASNFIVQDNTGDLAAFFGITTDAAVTEINSGDLDRKYFDRATLLNSLNGGEGIYEGSIRITDANGASSTGNLSGLKTVGEVITAINNSGLAVQAQINSTGDGIEIINTAGTGEIRIEEADQGSTAADLGILSSASGGASIDGSFETTIDISAEDTLNNLVYKVALSGAAVSTSIIDDGSGINQHHLSITSTISGKAGELMIDTDIFGLNFNESAEAQDALLLYGGGSGNSSPMLISNSDNNFRSAVPGMTISANQASPGETVTVSVNRDTDAIVTAIEEMVATFNDYSEVHDILTRWDEESETPGLLFGDSQANNMM
ncbi:MAG: flagellar filament capping protein FliD, partial [Planctomycetota bacterium]